LKIFLHFISILKTLKIKIRKNPNASEDFFAFAVSRKYINRILSILEYKNNNMTEIQNQLDKSI
jgi:hypothetical protein